MDPVTAIAHLEREGLLLVEAARAAGLATAVPTCPGWSVADLLLHTARVFRHKSHVLEHRLLERPGDRSWDRGDPAPHDAPGRYEEELGRVVAALRAADQAAEVWTFSAADPTVGFWSRRLAHEAAIHRIDAQRALGSVDDRPVDDLPVDLALDGVDEVLDVFVAPWAGGVAGAPVTVHLHATDPVGLAEGAGEWLVILGPDGVTVERGHRKGDAALRGSASDLDRWLWGRDEGRALEHLGDEAAVARLRSAATAVT